MLTLLPIACWGAIVLLWFRQGSSWREAFLCGAIVWGAMLTLFTETLSLLGQLSEVWIAICWGAAGVVVIAWFLLIPPQKNPTFRFSISGTEMALAGCIALLALVTFLTAQFAPPNTWDSMTYHMSRVMHWLQNGSVAHYPTAIIRQLELNPWAEFAIAHLQALSGGDRFANLVQWFSMVGSVLGASLIAGQLGAGQRGQVLAAVLVAAIPMGILQASSTQNDYVVSFWLLCFSWSGLRLAEEKSLSWAILTGLSLGLALLTKGTAYLYAFPYVLWFGWRLAGTVPRRHLFLLGLGIVISCLLVNAGHYYRNYALFGNPLSSDGVSGYANDRFTVNTVASNFVRNSAIHFSTPYESLNRSIEQGIIGFHEALGMDVNDEKITWPGETFKVLPILRHEDYSGNLLHSVLAIITTGLLALWPKVRRISAVITPYSFCVAAGFLIFCAFLKWQPWNSRLHLPLFVLGAPAMGVVLGSLCHSFLSLFLAVLLLVAAMPWALGNITRPLAPTFESARNRLVKGTPLPPTVITADRIPQYFTNRLSLWKPYLAAAQKIKERGASNIGLEFQEESWEYPLWVLLKGKDGKEPRIEHVAVRNRSGNIGLGDFQPDLIVKTDLRGIPIVMSPSNRRK